MKSFVALAVFASLAAQASAAFMVNTPASVVECQPALLTWQEGTAPYYPTIIPGGQPSGAALKTFDQTSSTQLTWNVDIPAGTSITIALRDSTGAQVFTDKVTITGSSASSCVSTSGSASASDTSGAETSTGVSATGSTIGPASGAATSEASSASSHQSGSSTSVSAAVATGTSSVASRIATTSSSVRPSGSAGVSAASSGASIKGASMKAAGMAGVLGVIGAALL